MPGDAMAAPSLDSATLSDAENQLEAALLKIRPKLDGVNGYGARFDPDDSSVSLSVSADAAGSKELSEKLPDSIMGVPVVVVPRKAAFAR